MTPTRKANGEHVEDISAATQSQYEPEFHDGDSDIIDDMSRKPPTREFEMLEVLLRLVDEQAKDRALLLQMAAKPPNGNGGKRWWVAPVVAGGIAVAGMFSVQFIPASTSVMNERVKLLEYQTAELKSMHDQIEYLKTWNEKLRNNMAAHGWLIDQEGNVQRVEQQQRRR